MILEWLAQAPVLLAALVVLFLPGALALWAVGLRGLPLAASAPLFTVAATGLLAIAYPVIGLAWSLLTWGVGVALFVVLAALLGWVLGRAKRPAGDAAPRWVIPAALAVGMLLGLSRLSTYIADPAGISQTNDAVFHMNAVRFIIDTADASSFHVNGVIGGASFYPAAWHAVVSIIVFATGASIPVAANMLTLIIGALIWPLGITWFTRIITGSTAIAGSAAVLSGALQTFPLLMFQWGVLFPNALSTAMLPAAIAMVISLAASFVADRGWRPAVRGILLALVVLLALMLAQPATVLPFLAILLVRFTARILAVLVPGSRLRGWMLIAGCWAALGVIWVVVSRGTSGSHWPPFRGKLEVFLDVLLNGQLRIPFAVGISILMLWGLVAAWRSRSTRWLVCAWIGISALYVLVASIGAPLVRINLLGAWYADPYRIAALAPVVVIPLAAIGLHSILATAGAAIRRGQREESELPTSVPIAVTLVSAAAIMIVLILVRPVAMPAVIEGTFDRESRYLSASDSYLSPDERELLEELPGLVEPGTRVIANPSTGSGFGYMLSGVDVFPRTWSSPRTTEWNVLADGLRDAGSDPAVCEALHAYGDPEYVLDFGLGDNTPGRYEMPGMTDFDDQPGFSLVSEVGDVSLWRITECSR